MFQLSDPGQRTLLGIARESVHSFLQGSALALPEIESGELAELRALFVSIHSGEELRGCVGNLYPASPLFRSTGDCAISAAVGDPRFAPLALSELPNVTFEISVLSPMERIRDVSEIEIGEHGVLVAKGRHRGLLLPQVAPQYGWDRERFLEETCRKAGLNAQDWKDGATLSRFTAAVFSENHVYDSEILNVGPTTSTHT